MNSQEAYFWNGPYLKQTTQYQEIRDNEQRLKEREAAQASKAVACYKAMYDNFNFQTGWKTFSTGRTLLNINYDFL
jgi:hypothetical protein